MQTLWDDARLSYIERSQADRISRGIAAGQCRGPLSQGCAQRAFGTVAPYTKGSTTAELKRALAMAERRVGRIAEDTSKWLGSQRSPVKSEDLPEHGSEQPLPNPNNTDAQMDIQEMNIQNQHVDALKTQQNLPSREALVLQEFQRLQARRLQRGARHAAAASRRTARCGISPTEGKTDSSGKDARSGRRWRGAQHSDPGHNSYFNQVRRALRGAQGRPCRQFLACRAHARSLQLKSVSEWHEYNRSGARPSNLPPDPHRAFYGTGWQGYDDWLGIGAAKSSLPVSEPAKSTDAKSSAGSWCGWREARRYATSLGVSREYLLHLCEAAPTIAKILAITPHTASYRVLPVCHWLKFFQSVFLDLTRVPGVFSTASCRDRCSARICPSRRLSTLGSFEPLRKAKAVCNVAPTRYTTIS